MHACHLCSADCIAYCRVEDKGDDETVQTLHSQQCSVRNLKESTDPAYDDFAVNISTDH